MMASITNAVRRLRFEHGEMTQAELATRIGMTRQTVAAIEQNKYSPSLEAAFRIARVFGVGLDTVFQWQEKGKAGGEVPSPPDPPSIFKK